MQNMLYVASVDEINCGVVSLFSLPCISVPRLSASVKLVGPCPPLSFFLSLSFSVFPFFLLFSFSISMLTNHPSRIG